VTGGIGAFSARATGAGEAVSGAGRGSWASACSGDAPGLACGEEMRLSRPRPRRDFPDGGATGVGSRERWAAATERRAAAAFS